MKQYITFLFFLLLAISNCPAQNLQAAEKKLAEKYGRINYWAFVSEDTAKYDSLYEANTQFEKQLTQVCKIPASITYPFPALTDSGLSAPRSADGLLRIYSWDTQTGGTMHFFSTVFQYAANKKTATSKELQDDGDPGVWYDSIYSVKAGGKTFYLASYHGVYSTRDRNAGIKAISLENGKLNTKVKLIKTGSGMNNTLDVPFDAASLDSDTYPVISYNSATQTILLPLIAGNGHLTGKTIAYRFNGSYFEKVKNK